MQHSSVVQILKVNDPRSGVGKNNKAWTMQEAASSSGHEVLHAAFDPVALADGFLMGRCVFSRNTFAARMARIS